MVFRRKRNEQPAVSQPEWRERFDASARTIRSKRPPEWVDDRLTALEGALLSAQSDLDRLDESIARLDPEQAGRDLKQALRDEQRRLPTDVGDGHEKRVALLRRRYAAVNEMMNRRRETERHVADAVADLELLALEAEHSDIGLTGQPHALDEHLQRLDIDLRALSMARDELKQW